MRGGGVGSAVTWCSPSSVRGRATALPRGWTLGSPRASARCRRLRQDRAVIEAQREKLRELGLTPDEVKRALEPALSFHEQLREEVETYERMRRGDISPIRNLTEIGRVLIGLRIARGMTQRELADLLGVSESQVSRDNRSAHPGITVEQIQRIIMALGGRVTVETEAPLDESAMATA